MNWLMFIAESSPKSDWQDFSDIWYWLFLALFFLAGFVVGLLIWRRMLSDVYTLERENRQLQAVFQKREKSYQDNRQNVSSVLGQDALNRR